MNNRIKWYLIFTFILIPCVMFWSIKRYFTTGGLAKACYLGVFISKYGVLVYGCYTIMQMIDFFDTGEMVLFYIKLSSAIFLCGAYIIFSFLLVSTKDVLDDQERRYREELLANV